VQHNIFLECRDNMLRVQSVVARAKAGGEGGFSKESGMKPSVSALMDENEKCGMRLRGATPARG